MNEMAELAAPYPFVGVALHELSPSFVFARIENAETVCAILSPVMARIMFTAEVRTNPPFFDLVLHHFKAIHAVGYCIHQIL